jgi:LysR family hca operon transcriptional activator
MDQRYLRYFIAVAEELNFTRAAERLHTVQPSLSQQIRRLEEIVGTPLFSRAKHRLELTEAGRIFVQEAREILQHTNRAVQLARKAARAEAGYITIGFVSGAETRLFARVLPFLREKYPDIRLSLRTLSEPELLAALQNHVVNVVFMAGPIEDAEIAAEPVVRHHMVAVVSASHPVSKLKRIPVARLAAIPLVKPSSLAVPAMARLVEQIAAQAQVQFQAVIEVDDMLATLNAVAAGLGFGLLPDMATEIAPRTIVVRPLDLDPQPGFDVLVAYRKDDRSPALRFFLSLLRERLQQQ